VTHEYVIGLSGRIVPRPDIGPASTAIAWAADRILAVGSDAQVRAISRGDSVFLDLAGCTVTPLPGEPATLDVVATRDADPDQLVERLIAAGRLDPSDRLEPGSRADLAFWRRATVDVAAGIPGQGWRVVAIVRAGAFTEGNEHLGPFARPSDPAASDPAAPDAAAPGRAAPG